MESFEKETRNAIDVVAKFEFLMEDISVQNNPQ